MLHAGTCCSVVVAFEPGQAPPGRGGLQACQGQKHNQHNQLCRRTDAFWQGVKSSAFSKNWQTSSGLSALDSALGGDWERGRGTL
eukprot:756153-Hanusia_phi.AAC.7